MLLHVTEVSTEAELLAALGPFVPGGSALILVGGADSMADSDRAALAQLFGRLVDYLDRTGTSVVDGGTDSGVMHLLGTLREDRGAAFRLVGVLPRGALRRRSRRGVPIGIAAGHPEIILVPGSRFGDETDWLFAAADHLGGGAAVTLVVNGGQLTLDEGRARLAAGHRVVAVAGSGRAADELAATLAADEDLRGSGRLGVISLSIDSAGLAAALEGPRAT